MLGLNMKMLLSVFGQKAPLRFNDDAIRQYEVGRVFPVLFWLDPGEFVILVIKTHTLRCEVGCIGFLKARAVPVGNRSDSRGEFLYRQLLKVVLSVVGIIFVRALLWGRLLGLRVLGLFFRELRSIKPVFLVKLIETTPSD